MAVRAFGLWIAVVATLAACRGGESASDAVEELVMSFSQGEYQAAWEMLHPAHQAVVPQQQFIECGVQAEQFDSPVVDTVDVTSTKKQTQTVPELGEIEVTTVSANLRVGDDVVPRSWDVVKVDGDWRWLLAEESLTDFREGRCPGQQVSA